MIIRLFLSNNSTFDFDTKNYVTIEAFAEDLATSQAFGKSGGGFIKCGDFIDFYGRHIRYSEIVAFEEVISE